MTDLAIRPASSGDHDALWAMLEPVFRAGDTYAVDSDIAADDALDYWCGGTHSAFIAESGGQPLGTYYTGPNQGGGGAHVCNCGFVTAPAARGQGVARAMLAHALDTARAMGYRAMQFNFVVETNTRALVIWRDYGFEVVGRLPGAFRHPREGFVDALVMYRQL
ncbi:GNAT family N-acetyltransferase [Rhodobacteraceae bacterium WD3A24]|nr:GNAT family N-acetyltransferase [Rhodobacteraceae bacterium WD3A24]